MNFDEHIKAISDLEIHINQKKEELNTLKNTLTIPHAWYVDNFDKSLDYVLHRMPESVNKEDLKDALFFVSCNEKLSVVFSLPDGFSEESIFSAYYKFTEKLFKEHILKEHIYMDYIYSLF